MIEDKILSRIKKCLALAKSSNPHEAAAALRQAKRLMDSHNVSMDDVALSDVSERTGTAGTSTNNPPSWLADLANLVCVAYGCDFIYEVHLGTNRIIFIGVDISPEIAEFTFTVLRRQLTNARSKYYKKLRGKRSNRVRKADVYAHGWVCSVSAKVREFASKTPSVVQKYMAVRSADLESVEIKRAGSKHDLRHAINGVLDADDVYLNHGVAGQSKRSLANLK